MKKGSNLEHQVFQLINTKFTNIKKCGLFLNQQYPLFGASPDGIGPDFVLEIKCPTSDKTFKKYVENDRIQPSSTFLKFSFKWQSVEKRKAIL